MRGDRYIGLCVSQWNVTIIAVSVYVGCSSKGSQLWGCNSDSCAGQVSLSGYQVLAVD